MDSAGELEEKALRYVRSLPLRMAASRAARRLVLAWVRVRVR